MLQQLAATCTTRKKLRAELSTISSKHSYANVLPLLFLVRCPTLSKRTQPLLVFFFATEADCPPELSSSAVTSQTEDCQASITGALFLTSGVCRTKNVVVGAWRTVAGRMIRPWLVTTEDRSLLCCKLKSSEDTV